MDQVRALMLSLATATLLAACNPAQNQQAVENPLGNDPNVYGWATVRSQDINVPRGVTYTTTNMGGATVAEISGVPDNAASTVKTDGVSVRLPDALEAQTSGVAVRIIVRAFAPEEGAMLGVAYSTNESGNSGWIQFPLSQTPTDYVFVYSVPAKRMQNGDYLGFRSYGTGHVRVVGFMVEPLPPAAGSQPAHSAADQDEPALRP